jgi:hypothetical protein
MMKIQLAEKLRRLAQPSRYKAAYGGRAGTNRMPMRAYSFPTTSARPNSPRASESRARLLPRRALGLDYFNPTTIESGPPRCSTCVFEKPDSRIHCWQSAPV